MSFSLRIACFLASFRSIGSPFFALISFPDEDGEELEEALAAEVAAPSDAPSVAEELPEVAEVAEFPEFEEFLAELPEFPEFLADPAAFFGVFGVGRFFL